MTAVSFEGGMVQVDATVVAEGLRMTPDVLKVALRDGTVTSRCEAGIGEDAGRFRVTFFSAKRRMQLVVATDGTILQRSTADYTRRGAP